MEVEKNASVWGEDKDVTEQLQTRQKSKYAKDFTETCLKEGEDSLVT